MTIDVDQSGKIEYLGVPTVIATSNGMTILVPTSVKDSLWNYSQRKKLTTNQYITRFFSVAVFHVIKDIIQTDSIRIDTEYTGKDQHIRSRLIQLLHKNAIYIEKQSISFGYVGKKSLSHHYAIDCYRGKRKPDNVLTLDEMLIK